MAPKMRLMMVLARLLMQGYAAWWSALVLTKLLSVRWPLQHPGFSVPLPAVYRRNDTRFEPTFPHVIAAKAFNTSSAANKATTKTYSFIRAAIAHSLSKALVGA
jgi:hypothetical protein